MQVVVNGTPLNLTEPTTLAGLLARLGTCAEQVAIEHNGAIIEREAFGQLQLKADDRLEIVHFVGGG